MRALRFWVVAIALVIAGPLIAFSMRVDSENISKILDHGKMVKARIDKVEWKTKHHIDEDYALLIDFKTEDGREISNKLRVDSDIGQKARDDNAFTDIDVRYLPENPDVVYQADVRQPSNSMYWIAVLVSLAGVGMIVWRLFGRKRSKN